jgi:hypothetical protein
MLEVARRAQRPLFDEDDAQTAGAEQIGGDAAAGTGADDDHIGIDRLAVRQMPTRQYVSSRRQARP